MKKLLAMLLALCFIFSLSTVSYAEGNLVECDDITLTFCCSAAETTCWAQMANVFADYVNERTTGNFAVEIYAMDQLTNGSQTEGIQAVCDGSIDLSAHSNLIYSNFDQRLNVVSLPFIFDSTEEVDEVLVEVHLHHLGRAGQHKETDHCPFKMHRVWSDFTSVTLNL